LKIKFGKTSTELGFPTQKIGVNQEGEKDEI
jgi:hypothetical protein